jgi:ketosteroid isomerase-like protein/glyoxylase-like metal-dependent hydrolase (beta-lactamase superfamily II)
MRLILISAMLMFATLAGADDTADVRTVLEQWRAANQSHDVEAAVALWSDDFVSPRDTTQRGPEGVRAAFGRLLSGRYGDIDIRLDGLLISVDGDSAFVKGVVVLTRWGASEQAYVLTRDPAGWRLLRSEQGGRIPTERILGGLGPSYMELLERWSGTALGWIDSVLVANPPNDGDRGMRRTAHLMLDEPLHLVSAPLLESVQRFHRERIDRAIDQMRNERVTEGVTIWKLYNHGFVVRTPNQTWAHDFYGGPEPMALTDEQIDAVLGQVDALFCSHWHGDHSSPRTIKRALAMEIPVLVSPLPDYDYIAHMKREIGYIDSVTPPPGLTVAELGSRGEVGGLVYHAYPGHQGDLPNDVFVVRADSITTMQTGDQSNDDDFAAWIDSVDVEYDVDVLLPNVWTTDIHRMLRGVKPRVVIPGHENELGHNFEHREPYAQAYEKLDRLETGTWQIMAWGERVHIDPREPRE